MNLSRLSLHTVLWALYSSIAAGDQVDQAQPKCPSECNLSDLPQVTQKIIDGEASLAEGSCKKIIHPEGRTEMSFKYTYNMEIQGGPSSNIPPINHNVTSPKKRGWYIETHNDVKLGSCLTLPSNIQGPFPQENVTTCINALEFSCYRLSCPCFDESRIMNLKKMLKKMPQDSGFFLDLERSCKDPKMNDGLPFGLYNKKNHANTWSDPGVISIGVDMNLGAGQSNECYDGDARFQDLNPSQHQRCISLVQSVCDELKTLPKRSGLCKDDPDFRYNGKPNKTCEFLTSRDVLSKKRIRRNCRKYDSKTEKFVFQQCRESCQSCTCADSLDFAYNGQPNFNCAWLRNLAKNKRIDTCASNKDVSSYCPVTCNSKCCKDSPQFKFWVRRHGKDGKKNRYQKMKCSDIGQNEWKELCKRNKVAVRCPMKCRKCPIQPRS